MRNAVGVRTGIRRPAVAVLLPGSGSDHVFVAAAFAQPLAMLGIRLIAPPPVAGSDVVRAMRRALRATIDGVSGGALVGGVSLGAHVAAGWAARNPGRCAGLLLALPAWLGPPAGAPAAVAAQASADAVRRDGVGRTLAEVRATAGQRWLADELDRAWRGYGDALADSLAAAAATTAPSTDELRRLTVPAGIVALSDDPLHPHAVARLWADALPRAAVVTTSLRAVGRDRATLGRAAVLGWLRAVDTTALDGVPGAPRSPA
jgi:pimeloyl-ACP methyl ester carboxylesterase